MDDFSATQSNISSALVSATRSVGRLAAEDISFHRSLDPTLGDLLDRQNERLLGLATRLLGSAASNPETVRPPSLKDVDSIDGNWRAVVDVVDSLLERADSALDEFAGAVKRLSPGAHEQPSNGRASPRASNFGVWPKTFEMDKPQLRFADVPTNRNTSPFKPLLLHKPHALASSSTDMTSGKPNSAKAFPHPYQHEIEQYQYPTAAYTFADPIPYQPYESTTATFVDTEEALEEMLHELKNAKEIAIDLEHHDQRSYIGIVCLMQISTRTRDWIVDTLKPWRRKLQCLNEVLADPSIIKVLHGAYMDAIWLQRDFGLYLVGLFDTHYAARALGYPGGSLAFLLKKFVNFDAQKQYQTADWRVRPLPKELFDYARSDTHFLLYIFDCMRNELIQRSDFCLPNHTGDKLWDVLQKSSEVALQRYENPIYDSELGQGAMGWYKMLSRTPALLSREQFGVFRAVHQWRDNIARDQDDSVNWVMPNHQIFSIAREMPTNRASLLGIAQPTSQVVRSHADELVSVISEAKENNKDGPEMVDVLNRVEPQQSRGAFRHTANHSVAGFLPKAETNSNGMTSSTSTLRSILSSFWGNSFESSAHQKRPLSTASNVSLSIPLPPLTAEVFAPAPTQISESVPPTPPEPEHVNESNDDIFTLNEMSRKRKQHFETSNGDGMATQRDEVSLSDEETVRARQKAENRKARKEEKRERKRARENNASDELAPSGEDQPFDYASAPSVFNRPPETREEMKARRKKEVNPYAKAMETSKGLPRIQKERAGKSMTYKS